MAKPCQNDTAQHSGWVGHDDSQGTRKERSLTNLSESCKTQDPVSIGKLGKVEHVTLVLTYHYMS